MQPSSFLLTTHGITVAVSPVYLDDRSDPEEGTYCWGYFVIIKNLSDEVIKLQTRFWKIIDGNGIINEIEGEGVVGEFPVLRPNEDFEYNSFVPLTTATGMMGGHYMFSIEEGERKGELLQIDIPLFSLDSPEQLQRAN